MARGQPPAPERIDEHVDVPAPQGFMPNVHSLTTALRACPAVRPQRRGSG